MKVTVYFTDRAPVLLDDVDRVVAHAGEGGSEGAPVSVEQMVTWAQKRLVACERTQRTSRSQRSRDWAYGEAVAIRAMLALLEGKETQG